MPLPRTQVARWRWVKGLTQEQLAEKAGVSVNTIWRMENGSTISSPKTVKNIAEILEVDAEVLLVALINDLDNQQQADEVNKGEVVVPIRLGADGERNDDKAASCGGE